MDPRHPSHADTGVAPKLPKGPPLKANFVFNGGKGSSGVTFACAKITVPVINTTTLNHICALFILLRTPMAAQPAPLVKAPPQVSRTGIQGKHVECIVLGLFGQLISCRVCFFSLYQDSCDTSQSIRRASWWWQVLCLQASLSACIFRTFKTCDPFFKVPLHWGKAVANPGRSTLVLSLHVCYIV